MPIGTGARARNCVSPALELNVMFVGMPVVRSTTKAAMPAPFAPLLPCPSPKHSENRFLRLLSNRVGLAVIVAVVECSFVTVFVDGTNLPMSKKLSPMYQKLPSSSMQSTRGTLAQMPAASQVFVTGSKPLVSPLLMTAFGQVNRVCGTMMRPISLE